MSHSKEFIDFALGQNALGFGEFTLKSGRISPYFFNAGLFNTGSLIRQLGIYYAKAIAAAGVEFDILFGPAYKGIPLVTSVAIAYSELFHRDVPYCFNRKEVKQYGEGGQIIGAPLKGRVLIIDDVITAGTAFNEAKNIITEQGARIAGIAVALDRQERGTGDLSAIDEIRQTMQIPVVHIASLSDIMAYCEADAHLRQWCPAIADYHERYRSKAAGKSGNKV